MSYAVENIGLLAHAQTLVKPAAIPGVRIGGQSGQGLPAHHGRGHGNPLPAYELGKDHAPCRPGALEKAAQLARAVKDPSVCRHKACAGIGLEERNLALQLVRLPEIVAVQKGYVLAPGPGYGKIAACSQRHLFRAPEVAHPVTVTPGYLRTGIRRAVVPEDDFIVCPGLLHDAVQRAPQVFVAVVAVHDDRNSWLRGHTNSVSWAGLWKAQVLLACTFQQVSSLWSSAPREGACTPCSHPRY